MHRRGPTWPVIQEGGREKNKTPDRSVTREKREKEKRSHPALGAAGDRTKTAEVGKKPPKKGRKNNEKEGKMS